MNHMPVHFTVMKLHQISAKLYDRNEREIYNMLQLESGLVYSRRA